MRICAGRAGVILWHIIHSAFARPTVPVGVPRNSIESGVREAPSKASFAMPDGTRVCRVDAAEDFREAVGRNADCVEDPEEPTAADFAHAMMHPDEGCDRFNSPGIPEGIIACLRR